MEKENSAKLPQKGVYTLIIKVAKEIRIRIGSLGLQKFRKGYYAYTGSALGASATSLKNRVRRHLRKAGKKKRWHIDFSRRTRPNRNDNSGVYKPEKRMRNKQKSEKSSES